MGRNYLYQGGGGEGYFGLQINDDGVQQAGDVICDALDLGAVPTGGSVGTAALSQSNSCATNTGDPTPPAWGAENTVWYMFQAPPSGSIVIDANSDQPFPFGTDAVDLQLAIYGTDNNTCTGIVNHVYSDYTAGNFDEDMTVRCLAPGQNYWLMVDGSALNTDGIFDITITDEGTFPAPNDEICDAIALGQPAPGGTVGLNNQHNYCADNLFEPIPSSWGNDQGVWYTFIAPPSGKVEVRLDNPNLFSDQIDLQVAVYDSDDMTCSGALTEIASEHEGVGLLWDEDMEVECLIPGRTYYILVDGEGSLINPDLQEGEFDIEVYGDPQDPPAANDAPCDAIALGDPTGGSVGTTPGPLHGSQNNFCADAAGEPQPSMWTADQTVWYTFVAPSTGAINLEITTDPQFSGVNPMDMQFAVYNSPGCTGPWLEEKSGEGLLYDVDVDLWCLNPGQTYYLQVDGQTTLLIEDPGEGYFDITITEIPQTTAPTNDDICSAVALGNPWALPASITGENNLCADDIGDPTPTAFGTDQTVWYTFTTPATGGPFALDIQATSDLPWPFGVDDVDLQLAVFESSNGNCAGSLTEMASSYSIVDQNDESLNVRCLEENTTYYLMVDGSFLNVQGYFDLDLTPAIPVPIPTNNDVCNLIDLGATPIGGSINTGTNYYNFCSNTEVGEPDSFLDPIDQTVWFSFVAPNNAGPNATSSVTINLYNDPANIGDQIDLQLAVYESDNGLCSGSMSLVENGSSESLFSFDASASLECLTPGATYFVQVDGGALNGEGYFQIEIIDDGPGTSQPYNAICQAENLGVVPNGGSINNGVDYENLCMNTEVGEAVPSAFGISSTAWFTFVAPTSGNVTINALSDPNLLGDAVDLQLALYYSSDDLCTGTLLEVDSDYDILSKDESLTVDCLEAGRIYYLQVDGLGGLLGDEDGYFTLEIIDDGGTSAAPYNNDICNAYDFGTVGALQTLLGETNVCANIEVGEPGVSGYATHTVWYEFIAPASGQVEINVTSTDPITGIDPEVYVLSSLDNTCAGLLTEVGASNFPTALITENVALNCLVPGNVYFVQVDGQLLELEGTFDISIENPYPDYGTGLPGDIEPSNNDCANATSLTIQSESCFTGTGVFDQFNYGVATPSITPPNGCNSDCGDIWYTFTMPVAGNVLVEGNDDAVGGLTGDYSTLEVTAYVGTCGSLTPLICDEGGLGDNVNMSVGAPPGSTVYLQVSNEFGVDDLEDFELCVSDGCGHDDCLSAASTAMLPGVPYCFNTSSATGEDIAGGDPGYDECLEGDNPEHSVYFSFVTDAVGGDVTVSIIDGVINGSCILGITPTDGFNVSIYEDNTPCDNSAAILVDCEGFDACDAGPINWSQTYTGLPPNTTYIIVVDGGFGLAGGNNSGEITVDGNIVLDVDLLDFTVEKNGRKSELYWKTLNEENNDFFTIERSYDAITFEVLQHVYGAGTSLEEMNYHVTDHHPFEGMNYYRLSQTDFNGESEELGMVAINHSMDVEGILVVPNPVNDLSNVVFENKLEEEGQLIIFNTSGAILDQLSINIGEGINTIPIDTHKLKAGAYIVEIRTLENSRVTRFIKIFN